MQVLLNNNQYMVCNRYPVRAKTTMPDKILRAQNNNISFLAAPATKPVMSTKIKNEKARMLKKINEILKTNIPVLNKEQLWEIIERRATAIIRMKNHKKISFEFELEAMYDSPYMSPQQKFNRVCEIEKEEKELDKIDPFEIPDYLIPKETKENYDYKLIEKFKLALNDNNFDLHAIYQEHYATLNEIQTLKELRETYPSLATQPSFDEIIADKVIKTMTRDAYEELDKAINCDDETRLDQFILEHFFDKSITALEELGINDPVYIKNFLLILSERFAKVCSKTVKENRLGTVPVISKNYIPEFSETDKIMSKINYDNFALHVLREHYLNGKKLNDITYTEGDITIKLTDLKGSEYKFEKFSENIKKFITDSEKVKQYQRDYLKFTSQELKERLLYYEKTEFGYDDDLFNLFAEFESCEFTQEDKNNLIILLKELDKISDGKKTLEEGKLFLKESNIHPHGTDKINEAVKKEARAQIRAEQLRNEKLTNIRKEFNNTVNELYEIGLISEADLCMKYYPLTPDDTELEYAEKVINFIKKTIENNDKNISQKRIARWEIYNEYLKNDTKSIDFKDAQSFASDISEDLKEDTIGQYLLNRNIVDGYPESAKLFPEQELLEDIIKSTNKNKDLATRLLCKYENYSTLPSEKKQSILEILKIFDFNSDTDRIPLKFIVENDYINQDTAIFVERGNFTQKRTICDTAKLQLFDRHNFPNSVPFFEKFEQALPLDAPYRGGAGVKKLTGNHKNKKTEIAEVKITGHDDRLVADNYDYRFERYDPIGIH